MKMSSDTKAQPLIEETLKDKDYCDGCLFLREGGQYNRDGDIFDDPYDYKGYECIFRLSPGTHSIGYAAGKELLVSGHTLKRAPKCKHNYDRITVYLEEIVRSMDLSAIHAEGSSEYPLNYYEGMKKIIEKMLRYMVYDDIKEKTQK